MELSPQLYHWLVRPQWFTRRHGLKVKKDLFHNFDFENKISVDFGCGIGSSCCIFPPNNYIGIDSDSHRINYAQKLHRDYQFLSVKSPQMPLANNSIDYVFIMAVLHHISDHHLLEYLEDFHRILKPHGKIIVVEPCYFSQARLSNWYMKTFDKGAYIRDEKAYLNLFNKSYYQTEVMKHFKKYVYNELFFTASPI